MERCGHSRNLNQAHDTRFRVDDTPFQRGREHDVQHRENVIHGLWGLVFQADLELLHVFSGNGIQSLLTKRWYEMYPEDGLLVRYPTWLQPIRHDVPFEKPGHETL